MTIHDEIALRLLARTNVLHFPLLKTQDLRRWQAVWQHRDLFFEAGLPHPVEGGDLAAQKAAHRALADLCDRGVVSITRPTAGRVLAKLTDAGDAEARRRAWHCGQVSDALHLIGELIEAEAAALKTGDYHFEQGHRWIIVDALPGCEPDGPDQVAEAFGRCVSSQAGIVRGWILGNTSNGKPWWAVTAQGRAAFEAAGEIESHDGEPADQEAAEFYRDAENRAWRRLATLKPLNDTDCGRIPIPSSPPAPTDWQQQATK